MHTYMENSVRNKTGASVIFVISKLAQSATFNLNHSLGIFSRRQIDDIFSYFSQKTGSDISCKLSPEETICMQCQILFSGKNKKNISKCRLLKILPRVLSVKEKCSKTLICITLWANSADDISAIFFLIFPGIQDVTSSSYSSGDNLQKVCTKCQILFLRK